MAVDGVGDVLCRLEDGPSLFVPLIPFSTFGSVTFANNAPAFNLVLFLLLVNTSKIFHLWEVFKLLCVL